MPVGIAVEVIAKHVDTAISAWDELGIVVAGTIIAAGILWLLARVWRRVTAPKLIIESGDSDAFQKIAAPHDIKHYVDCGGLAQLVYISRLRVRETRNRQAQNVHARVVGTDPPSLDRYRPGMEFVNGATYYTVPPKGEAYLVLCEMIDCQQIPAHDHVLTSVPNLSRGRRVEFTVEVLVDGRKNACQTFIADWTNSGWPYPAVSAA